MGLPVDMNAVVGAADVLFLTLDTLRYDVAQAAWAAGRTPRLAALLPPTGWEERHTPGNFTLAAHHAFFSGFLPTPLGPHPHPRPFAAYFQGSISCAPETCVFDAPDIIRGFAGRGYHTACIGGVGFFNKLNPLGQVLPSYFQESHWATRFNVYDPRSTEHQVAQALEILARTPGRLLLFINVSALHAPNHTYLPGAERDGPETMAAALAYVDAALAPLLGALRARGPAWAIVCADHGTAYGEDGYWGHRLNHPTVLNIPYAEGWL